MSRHQIETTAAINPLGHVWSRIVASGNADGSTVFEYAEEVSAAWGREFLEGFEEGFLHGLRHRRRERGEVQEFRIRVEEAGVVDPASGARFRLLGAFAASDLMKRISRPPG